MIERHTVNEAGYAEIRRILGERSNLPNAIISVERYAKQVEAGLDEYGDDRATFEIRSSRSVSGRAEVHSINMSGVDVWQEPDDDIDDTASFVTGLRERIAEHGMLD